MFLPPVLRPRPSMGPVSPAVQRIAETPLSVVRGAPGSFVAERLAGAIDSCQRLGDCVWLRAGDSLPTNLAQSLGAACLHRWSPGEHRSGRMGDSRLDEELAVAPEGAVIVVELGGRMTAEVARLVRAIQPAITDRGVRLVVVAEGRFHSPETPGRPGSLVAAS